MARILVIDDNADLLQMVRVLLEDRGGHEVILSADGQDGLAKARAERPDLAILDVMMPGITGYDVCRRLREEPATTEIPIIILTARGQPIDRETALAAGADEYIAKPITMAELLEQVNKLLARKATTPSVQARGTAAVLGLRGGMGVTTLAVNLAIACAHQAPDQVCLVDLCPFSGHAALQLGLRPEPNWSALPLLSSGPDPGTIHDYLLTHPVGLHLLAAPFVPVVGEGLRRDLVLATLSALGQNFATVVVDLPSALTEGAMAALENVSLIVLVTTADPPAIQTAVGTLQVLRPLVSKIRLVLNQVVEGTPPPLDALQRVLRQPFVEVIPFDSAQAQALAERKPLTLTAPGSPLTLRVARLAKSLRLTQAQPAAT